jgi:hypothetical protein
LNAAAAEVGARTIHSLASPHLHAAIAAYATSHHERFHRFHMFYRNTEALVMLHVPQFLSQNNLIDV